MSVIIRWIAHYYIRNACHKACNSFTYDYLEILRIMIQTIRDDETESNDSTIYSMMLDDFNKISRTELPHVSEGLRKLLEAK